MPATPNHPEQSMPVPRTIGELIDQTWPDAQEVHDIEIYLDRMLEKWGG